AERMTQIEQRPVAGLEFVALDHVGLGFAGFGDGMRTCLTAGKYVPPVLLEPGEKVRPVDQAIFCNLGISGPEFALWQRIENVRIRKDKRRLLEHSDEILAPGGIDARLATDR